ncbi:Glucan 1,4-alpha-maltohexaosidase [Mycena kentingensis (nom. inval.)]|nr:Glucan 1,4-alpha-maltohexaosidase [Mycena kentingensis (nom. inval.)]
MFAQFREWLYPPSTLQRMRLAPPENTDNPLMLQFFTWDHLHPTLSWWAHFECEIPKLAEMGFTQVWLPPPHKAASKDGRGYDVYDLWDLGEFDQKGSVKTRWGTRDELLRACKIAKDHGIDVLIDAVLGHRLGADRLETFPAVPVNPNFRLQDVGPERKIDAWTAFDFKGRDGKYSNMKWTQEHFTGIDWDHKLRKKGVFRFSGPGHRGWSRHVSNELGNYDYLLGADVDHRHPDVQKDLLDWGVWILETTGASGFRMDAIKHFDYRFLAAFLKHVRTKRGEPQVFSVAEYWHSELKVILPFMRVLRGETTFFDVPLHSNFHSASKAGPKYDLRRILHGSMVQAFPGDAVTFVDNHDTHSLHLCQTTLTAPPPQVIGQSLESWVTPTFKLHAYALILLRPGGHPCVFYGDMYPNALCGDAKIMSALPALIEARRRFAYGACRDFVADRNCVGFVRMGRARGDVGGCAVVLSNGEKPGSLRMFVGRACANADFRAFMPTYEREGGGKEAMVKIDAAGWGTFTCSAGGVQVWVRA